LKHTLANVIIINYFTFEESVEKNNYMNTFLIPLLKYISVRKGYKQELKIVKISLKSIFSWIDFMPRNDTTLVISFSEEQA